MGFYIFMNEASWMKVEMQVISKQLIDARCQHV